MKTPKHYAFANIIGAPIKRMILLEFSRCPHRCSVAPTVRIGLVRSRSTHADSDQIQLHLEKDYLHTVHQIRIPKTYHS